MDLKHARDWLIGWVPAPLTGDRFERMRASSGALMGILLTGLVTRFALGEGGGAAWLIAPMGASAVLLFAVPGSPLAQPWSILGGNLVSALIGVTCARVVTEPLLAAAVAGALAIGMMLALRCLHPPSGAVALTAVLGGPAVHAAGYGFVLFPVAINSLLLLGAALAFNNATGRRYPHRALDHRNIHQTTDALPSDRLAFAPADLDAVLKRYNEVIDISRNDLEVLLQQTEMQAYRRRFGEITCSDIMSRDVVTVEYGTALEEAWRLMLNHRIKVLPVVDRAKRVIGVLTQTDFMRHVDVHAYDEFGVRLKAFLKRSGLVETDKPEVVGQIMHAPAKTVGAEMFIVELVPLLSDSGLHHVPVVDHERRLAGIVTQTDLVAALYRGCLREG